MTTQDLSSTIAAMVVKGKGILAADESNTTIAKRLKTINVESTDETRRDYRETLFTTPDLGAYISGIILYEETLGQKTRAGVPFVDVLKKQGIVPGIKVDKGIVPLPGSPNENITQGLDGLGARLAEYKKMGARFAKWRAVLSITANTPTAYAIHANAEALARYASICQSEGIVPIVEPELLMEGDHTLERCQQVTEYTLHTVFHALYQYKVVLEQMILKPGMVVAGTNCKSQPTVEEVAEATLKVLRRTVPAAVPSINFLSGGQSDELATAHLNAMNRISNNPWQLSYSYGRALQAPALKTWAGKDSNIKAAQEALFKRAKLNSAASVGNYMAAMEA